jgi:hypothetical protein
MKNRNSWALVWIAIFFGFLGYFVGNYWPIFYKAQPKEPSWLKDLRVTPSQETPSPPLSAIQSQMFSYQGKPIAREISVLEPKFNFLFKTNGLEPAEVGIELRYIILGKGDVATVPASFSRPSGAGLGPEMIMFDGIDPAIVVIASKIKNRSRDSVSVDLGGLFKLLFEKDNQMESARSNSLGWIQVASLSSGDENIVFTVPESEQVFQLIYGPLDNPTGVLEIDFDKKTVTRLEG